MELKAAMGGQEEAAELEQELLLVAGQSGRPRDTSQQAGPVFSSDISEDDISDVNEDKEMAEGEVEEVGEEVEDDFDDEDDVYDEQRLANMTELEREMELAERAERQQQKRQREELLRAAGDGSLERRRSGREAREESKKKSAIEELKAARERKARGDKAHLPNDRLDFAEPSRKRKKDTQMNEDEYSEEEILDDDFFDRLEAEEDIDLSEEEEEEKQAEASYEEVKSIQIRRHRLEEWMNKPFFEKTVPGCMVRLAAGNKKAPDGRTMYGPDGRPVVQYMAAKVSGLIEREPGYYKYLPGSAPPWKSPYQFGKDRTNLWLKVIRGNSERIWPLAQVSNSSITEQEFTRFHEQCEQAGVPQISRGQVEKARSRLVEADTYVYTAEDVAKLLELKRSKGKGSRRNAALEKARLERERDAAEQRGDSSMVQQLTMEIFDLENTLAEKQALEGSALAAINKKNASLNFKATVIGDEHARESGGGGADGDLDPFRRRVTRPILYWNTTQNNQQQEGDGKIEGLDDYMKREPVEEHKKAPLYTDSEELLMEQLFKQNKIDVGLIQRVTPVNVIVRRLCGSLHAFKGRNKMAFASEKFLVDPSVASPGTYAKTASRTGGPERSLQKQRNTFFSVDEFVRYSASRSGTGGSYRRAGSGPNTDATYRASHHEQY